MRKKVRLQSDELDEAIRGYVLANRVNDMVARPTSKRYLEYLRVVNEQWQGGSALDPRDQYREEAKALLSRAADALRPRWPDPIETGYVYYHPQDGIPIAAVPDAVSDTTGMTFHIRKSPQTYSKAREIGITPEMYRQSQAMMAVTGKRCWLQCNYLEKPETRIRKLSWDSVSYDKHMALHLEEEMLAFVLRTRHAA